MARLNAPDLETAPVRRSARNAKQAQPEDEGVMETEYDEAEPSPVKGKGKGKSDKAMPPPPTPMPGAHMATPAPSARATPAPGARLTRAQLRALTAMPEDRPISAVVEQAGDMDADGYDASKITSKSTAAVVPKKPVTARKTRGQARAESEVSEPMVVSVYKEDADMEEDDAPQITVKPKTAAKKAQTMRKTHGQTVLSQIAEAGTREEQEFYDAEEEHGKMKTEAVGSELEEGQVVESVKPVKKGRFAEKVIADDDLMVVEQAKESDEPVKPKRGRKPAKKAQPPKIKQEEISDSDADNQTLDQKLASLTLGQMTLGNVDEPVKPKPKTRARPRKNTQTKKNASLDVSGLDLALSYFIGIRDLAMGGVDEENVQKILEMADQGMETIQAALDGVKQE